MYVANEEPEELKNPEKVAKSLRIDHSRVHYENGRLTEMLHANLTEISANQHRQLMSRNNEIKEIRQTVEDYKTILKTQKRAKKGAMRPQTSSVYLSQRKRTPSPNIKRITHSTTPTVRVNDESDSDESTLYDDDPFRNPRTKSAPAANRKSSMVSVVSNSSLRSNSVKSDSTVFQTQLGRAPQWLTPNPRDERRRPGSLMNGKQIYKKPEQPLVRFQNEWDEGDGFQMICGDGNQTLSRRQLKQLTNVDRFVQDERRKRYARYYEALMKNRDERDQLEARVKDFIRSLLDRNRQLAHFKIST